MDSKEIFNYILQAIILFDDGEKQLACEYLKTAANAGNRDAMVILAEMLTNQSGHCQTIDDMKRIIAKKKDCTYILYRFYCNSESKSWLKKAADLGSSRAMAILGHLDQEDEGISKNWLKQAVNKGSWQAKVDLLEIWGIQTDPYLSEDEYASLLSKLEGYAMYYPSASENIKQHREAIEQCYAQLRYGSEKQVAGLSYFLARMKCSAVDNYAVSKSQYGYNSQQYYYAHLFGDLENPIRNKKPFMPVEFLQGACMYDNNDREGYSYRVIKINLACFEEPDPIIGFCLDFGGKPVPIKGFEEAGTTTYRGGELSWMEKERECFLLKANRNIPLDENFCFSLHSNYTQKLFSSKDEIFFCFVAEKDFSFEITHHSKNGNGITMLYCHVY